MKCIKDGIYLEFTAPWWKRFSVQWIVMQFGLLLFLFSTGMYTNIYIYIYPTFSIGFVFVITIAFAIDWSLSRTHDKNLFSSHMELSHNLYNLRLNTIFMRVANEKVKRFENFTDMFYSEDI